MKLLKWRLKGPNRDEWFITATRFGDTDPDEDGNCETRWDMVIFTSPAQPDYRIAFHMITPAEPPPVLSDIWTELNSHFATLTLAAILTWDIINGKKLNCDWASNPWAWAISFRVVDDGGGQ